MIRLFELREEKNLSQRDMAKALFISQGTYNNWENGKTQPSIEQLILLSRFFNVSIDYIVGNDEMDNSVKTNSHLKEQKNLLDTIQDCVNKLKEI